MRRIFFALIFVVLVSWGCHKKPVAMPGPAGPPTPAPSAVTPEPREPAALESAPIAKTIVSPSNFEVGEKNFRAGNYPRAINSYEDFLSHNPKSKEREVALFHLGLSWIFAADPNRDLHRAEGVLKQMMAEYPSSSYKPQAELILNYQAQLEKLRLDIKERDERIKKLSEELQILKEIDLQRKPSRPE